jgi:hypothetical protein
MRGIESCLVIQWLLLTLNAQEMRKERCWKLLNKLKVCRPNQLLIFSHEKLFIGNVAINCCNSRYLADLPVADMATSIPIYLFSKAPLKQLVLGVVDSDGQKCPIVSLA